MNLKRKEEDIFDVLLKDGEIIDPARSIHFVGSLGIKNGRIASLGKDLPGEVKKVIPLQGKILTPGLIDLHCHPSPWISWERNSSR
jgi:predicted amidohydrolase